MRLMLVNNRQKVAALASGLAIATTGFVTESAAAGNVADPDGKATSPAAAQLGYLGNFTGASAGSSSPSSSHS